MSTDDLQSVFEYIATVELASDRTNAHSSRPHACVDRAAIELIPDSVPEQQREDALNWILFGQLAADAAAAKGGYSRTTDPERWYKSFIHFLGVTGMQSSGWDRRRAKPDQLAETVSETALNLLKPLLSDDEPHLAENALRDLQHDNQQALNIFNEAASDKSAVNFLLIGASVDSFLNLILHLTFIDFQTYEPVDVRNVLYWPWDREQVRDLFYGRDKLTLSKSLADRTRTGLRRRLDSRIPQNIAPINEY